ncbi:Uncharacterised protein [Yersinia pseudotuberculosis]|nr:Uncharacterised protein [Yersinia pseudotuberculosis]
MGGDAILLLNAMIGRIGHRDIGTVLAGSCVLNF